MSIKNAITDFINTVSFISDVNIKDSDKIIAYGKSKKDKAYFLRGIKMANSYDMFGVQHVCESFKTLEDILQLLLEYYYDASDYYYTNGAFIKYNDKEIEREIKKSLASIVEVNGYRFISLKNMENLRVIYLPIEFIDNLLIHDIHKENIQSTLKLFIKNYFEYYSDTLSQYDII